MVRKPRRQKTWLLSLSLRCRYAANLEKAISKLQPLATPDPEGDLEPERFHTPRAEDHRRGFRIHEAASHFTDEKPSDGGRRQTRTRVNSAVITSSAKPNSPPSCKHAT